MEPNWVFKGAEHPLSFIAKRHRAWVEGRAREEIEGVVRLVFKEKHIDVWMYDVFILMYGGDAV